jgi:hypothetical protein
MKATYLHAAAAIALTFGLAACVSAPEPAPAPAPPPVVRPAPTPTPAPPPMVQEPRYDNYLDAPQTLGDWAYSDESSERYAAFIAPPDAITFAMVCEGGEIELMRAVSGEGLTMRAMSITTETVTRQLQATAKPGRSLVGTRLAANDPLLDAMALTKGRFAVEVEGERTLYLPAWAEVTRVIEDCR